MSRTKVQLVGDAQGGANFTGVVTATSFSGDGSNLTGITAGATLGSSSDTERVVLTGLTTGTMTSASTNAGLTWNSTTNTLSATNVSIAGTLTYEDVTNVDSIGLVTARSGAHVIGDNLLVGSTSATGTSSQPLQVTGGAYVSGNLGVGVTNPSQKLHLDGSTSNQVVLALQNSNTGGNSWLLQSSGGSASNGQGNFSIFDSNASQYRLVINSSGNVGIGTTNPSATLDIRRGSGSAFSLPTNDNEGWIAKFYNFTDNSTENGVIIANRWASSASTVFEVGGLYDNGNGFDTFFTVNGAGNVGIGTTNPSTTLQVNGTATVTTLVETSSITLKENINPIENALDKILQLNPVTYDRKNNISKNEAGLIAEEVNEILPNIVSKDGDGNPNGINYTKLSVYLIDAIKTLKKEIEDLRNGNS